MAVEQSQTIPQSFNNAFDQAWKQSEQQQAQAQQQQPVTSGDPQFDKAFDQAWDKTLSQARSVPAQVLDFPEEFNAGISAGLYEQMAGLYGKVGDFFDPSAKYSEQNATQLYDGMIKQQARLAELQKQMADRPDSYFDKVKNGIEAAGIEQSIRAMEYNLQRIAGKAAAPTITQRIGQEFKRSQLYEESLARQELGQEPMRTQGPLLDYLSKVEQAEPLTRETASAAYARQLGGNAAYVVPELALTAAGAPILGGATGFLQFYGGAREQAWQETETARAQGLDPGTAVNYADLASQFAPISWAVTHTMLRPFLGGQSGLIVQDVLKNVIRNAGLFSGTVESQNVYNNTVALLSGFDPHRKWNENMGRATMDNVATMGAFAAVPEVFPFVSGRMLRPVRGSDLELGGSRPGLPNVAGQTTSQPVSAEAQLNELEASMRHGAALPQSAEASAATPRLTTPTVAEQLPSSPETRALPQSSWAAELGRMAAEWRKGVGDRLRIQAASPSQLPIGMRAGLRSLGVEPEDYTTFIDKRDGTVWVNPRRATPEQVQEAVVRNWSKYGFADKTNVQTLDSWRQGVDNPNIARLLLKDPNADSSTHELYDRDTGITYINVPRHLQDPDPVQSLFNTMSHVIGGHQGVTYIGGNDLNGFLLRRYGDLVSSGMGDHIWSKYGLTLDQAADKMGLLRDASGGLYEEGKRRLADETMSRYAEQFSPRKFDEMPSVLQRLTELVQRNMSRYEGMNLTRDNAFRMIQNGWRYSRPLALPEAEASQTAKSIIKSHEPHELVSVRGADPETVNLHNASIKTSANASVPTSRGDARSVEDVRASGDRVSNIPRESRHEYAQGELAQRAPNLLPVSNGAEHESRLSNDGRYILDATRPESATGPYGSAPSFPPRPGANGQGRTWGGARATLAEYLQRLRLANKFFGSGHQLEGFQREGSWWRVVSSRPRINGADNFRPANNDEITGYMAERGFHQVDAGTYYNPSDRILVLQADGGNIAINNETGEVVAHNVAPFNVEGPMQRALDGIAGDQARRAGMENSNEIQRWLDAYSGLDPVTQAKLIAQAQADHTTLRELRNKAIDGRLTPEEQAQMDAIEYGPLLKRDVEAELGPGSPDEPASELLKRAIEDQRRSMPREQYERVHAARAAQDPDTPPPVQAFNAAADQLLADKGGEAFSRGVIDNLKRLYQGNLSAIANDLIGGKFDTTEDGGYRPFIYGELTKEIRARRADAVRAGDQGAVGLLDAAQMRLDDYTNKLRTHQGKDFQAWQSVYGGREGLYRIVRSQYGDVVREAVGKKPGFDEAVKKVKQVVRETSKEMPNDPNVQRALNVAQEFQDRQEGGKRAVDWAETIGRDMVQQALRARMLPARPEQVSDIYRALRQRIEAQVREAGIKMDRDTRAKLSATETIGQAMRTWPFLYTVRDWLASEGERVFATDPEMARQFRELTGKAMEVPFSKAELGRFAREEGVNIGELVKAHRSQTGQTIETLQDFLLRQTDLDPEQTQAVSKAVSSFINEAIAKRRQAEFDKIIEAAGKRKKSAQMRGTTSERLQQLVHMGAFGDDEVANALAPIYGFKGYDPAMNPVLEKLADQLHENIQAGKDGFQTYAARAKINRALANYAQFSGRDVGPSLYQSNIVATEVGHVIGAINEMLTGHGDILRRWMWNEKFNLRALIDANMAWLQGLGEGSNEFRYIMKTGHDPARFQTLDELRDLGKNMKSWEGAGFFERRPLTRFFERQAPFLKPVGQVLEWHGLAWDRGIHAWHNMIRSSYGKAGLYMAATQYARNNLKLKGGEALDWAHQSIFPNDGIVKGAEQRAETEGLKPGSTEYKMRVNEIIEQKLPKEVLEAGDWSGNSANAFESPMGMPGLVYQGLQQIAKPLPEVHFIIPIVKLPLNLLNHGLDMFPASWFLRHYGILNKLSGSDFGAEGYLTARGTIEYSDAHLEDLKQQLLARGIFGSGLFATLLALTTYRKPDGDFAFPIHGAGPTDKQHKYQLMDQGWHDHSFQTPWGYVGYEWSNAWMVLDAIGNYQDAQRYQGMPPGLNTMMWAVQRTLGGAIMERSVTRGMNDLIEAIKAWQDEPDNEKKWGKFYGKITQSTIPIAGATWVRHLYQQFLDDKLYQSNGWGSLVRDTPFAPGLFGLKPELNILGEPIHMHPYAHRFWSNTPDDQVWQFLAQHNDLWLPKYQMVKKAQAIKLFGAPLSEDQKYDFIAFRGQHLRKYLYDNLDSLRSADADELEKAIKKYGSQANKDALRDLIDQKTPIFEQPQGEEPGGE